MADDIEWIIRIPSIDRVSDLGTPIIQFKYDYILGFGYSTYLDALSLGESIDKRTQAIRIASTYFDGPEVHER